MPERERAVRRPVQLQVTVRRRGELEQGTSGRMMDVSAGGAYVATYEPLPPGTPVVVEIDYPGRTFVVSGRIVHNGAVEQALERSVFSAGMGMQFDMPDDPGVKTLSRVGRI